MAWMGLRKQAQRSIGADPAGFPPLRNGCRHLISGTAIPGGRVCAPGLWGRVVDGMLTDAERITPSASRSPSSV